MVWVNSENNPPPPHPVRRMKASGVGRDGGDWSFDFYMETKNVCIALDTHDVAEAGSLSVPRAPGTLAEAYAPRTRGRADGVRVGWEGGTHQRRGDGALRRGGALPGRPARRHGAPGRRHRAGRPLRRPARGARDRVPDGTRGGARRARGPAPRLRRRGASRPRDRAASRYPDGPQDLCELVADNASADGFVLGPPRPIATGLRAGGGERAAPREWPRERTGVGADVLGSPLRTLAWLAETLLAPGHQARGGRRVLAGSLVAPYPAQPGERVEGEISGVGRVGCTFAGESAS